MDLQEMWWEGMKLIKLAQDWDKWWIPVMNIQFACTCTTYLVIQSVSQ